MSILCVKDVAVRLGISERTAAGLLQRGELRGFKLSGRVWRTTEQDLLAYVRSSIQQQRERRAA